MKRIKTFAFSLDIETMKKFYEICDKDYLNKSKIIGSLVREFIERYKK